MHEIARIFWYAFSNDARFDIKESNHVVLALSRSRESPLVSSLDRNRSSSVDSLEHTESLETAEVPSSQMELIQPTELVISTPSIERAECILSPQGKIL